MLVQHFILKRSRYSLLVGDLTIQGLLYANGVAEVSFTRNSFKNGVKQSAKFCKNGTHKCSIPEKTNVKE
jgi:hypothetical protein